MERLYAFEKEIIKIALDLYEKEVDKSEEAYNAIITKDAIHTWVKEIRIKLKLNSDDK